MKEYKERSVTLKLDGFDPLKVRFKPVFSSKIRDYVTKPYRIIGWSTDNRVVTVEIRHKWNRKSRVWNGSISGEVEEIKVFLVVQQHGNTNQHPPITIPYKFNES